MIHLMRGARIEGAASGRWSSRRGPKDQEPRATIEQCKPVEVLKLEDDGCPHHDD